VRSNKDGLAIALMGGFAEIENNEVTILVNGAERGDGIDREAAKAAYSAAESRASQLKGGENSQAQIQSEKDLKRARARFQAAGGMI
jgi:F-type H+-transporting ATPase subunit epsilon